MIIIRHILLLFVLFTAQVGHAQTFPALTGRVVDGANLLSAGEEAALTQKLQGLETQSGRQLVVATVPDLQGYPIDDYGYRLGRAWAIGDKQKDDGVILLVAPNDRKVRIEVGYGANVFVTDALSSVIINSLILPKFKAGDFPGGINAGADGIISQMKLPPDEAVQRAKALVSKAQKRDGPNLGTVIFWLFIFFFFILQVISPILFGRGRRGRRYGSGPVIIWGGGSDWGGGGSSWGSGGGFGGGGGFSGGGGSFGGGGASGGW